MFCIKCHSNTTTVTNTRPNKKEPKVWRRRRCVNCGFDFTTQEKPVLTSTIYVLNKNTGAKTPFYQGVLIRSIAKSFAHDEQYGIINAPPLCETIIAQLEPVGSLLTTDMITDACHTVLKRFDTTAAAQYALAHKINGSTRRKRKGI